jgi:hypothetical protein
MKVVTEREERRERLLARHHPTGAWRLIYMLGSHLRSTRPGTSWALCIGEIMAIA